MQAPPEAMKLYFMGICGTAMGNAALLLRAAGHEVLGADTGVYPPMSTVLAAAGIEILSGYDPGRLAQLAPDLVVIGNAMSRGNPEVEWLLDQSGPPSPGSGAASSRRISFTSLPALLHDHILAGRRNIVVAGTHGKTSTTALTAFLLRELGGDPGFLIGGVPQDPPMGAHLGRLEDPFVIEGDEYDSAFFDKRSKFIHYAPEIALLNNLEFDHADIFRDLVDVQRTFSHFARVVPTSGWIVRNGDDQNLAALGPFPWTRVLKVGIEPGNDLRIVGFAEDGAGARFTLEWCGHPWASFNSPLPGLFNARNFAMAAMAVQLARLPRGAGISEVSATFRGGEPAAEALAAALPRFRGVRRRQEILHATKSLTVVEDFGHHPTALAETLRSFRARFPGSILTAVFEPRSNTARSRALQAGFMRALAAADEVYLGAVNRADKLAESERFDTEAVAQHLETQGIESFAAPTSATLLAKLSEHALAPSQKSRVVIFFTNGSFDGIIPKFVSAAKS